MKTTPKPKATKKSRGELVGPPPPPPELDVVGPAGADEVWVGVDMADEVEGQPPTWNEIKRQQYIKRLGLT